MKTKRTFIWVILACLCLSSWAQANIKGKYYLFTYFTGNAPEQEQICYAVSTDGFNYTWRKTHCGKRYHSLSQGCSGPAHPAL